MRLTLAAKDRAIEYYKRIETYHQIAEESHGNQMVGPELLLRYVDVTGRILDVAGGTGFNAELLRIPPLNYYCVDLSFTGLKIVKEKGRGSAIQTDGARLPMRDGTIDVVLCSWSLEHFPNPGEVLDEMIRVVKPSGRVAIWGPNWDNIFRKDFPQFAHKSKVFVETVRWQIFFRMLRNEFLSFRYRPFTSDDVVALVDPTYVAYDSDAMHCVLCQETVKFFKMKGCEIVHIADFSEMRSYVYNDVFIRSIRRVLKRLLPVLRHVPFFRWFVIRFPIVVQKPEAKQ